MVSKRKTSLSLSTDLKTILSSVFLILLGMTGNYSDKLLGCKLQKILDTNIYAKHIMLIFIIFFTLDFAQKNNIHPMEKVKVALSIWFLILLVNKMNIELILLAAFTLAGMYVNNIYIKYYTQKDEESATTDNELLLDILRKFDLMMKYFFVIIVVCGSVHYFVKKRTEYKDTWNTLTYVLGVVKCRNT